MFNNLDDQTLLEAYYEAVHLQLGFEFISILKEELDNRGITEILIRKTSCN
jgi:hypothetical protein